MTGSDQPGLGRRSSGFAEQISAELRLGVGEALQRRRRIAGLALASSAAMGVVTAYQAGLLRHLPEPALPGLDADRVDASGEAYRFLATPDAALGLVSYAVTAALALAGPADRAERWPAVPLVLAAKALGDAAGGLVLTVEQATRHRRFCSWCLAAAAASVAALPLALPEAAAAWRSWRSRG